MIRRYPSTAIAVVACLVSTACDTESPTLTALRASRTAAPPSFSANISGHISGQIIGPNAACNGALTEIGTFTGQPGGTFVACVTSQQQRGDGALVFDLVHTYTTDDGNTFNTSDHVVAGPISPPIYRISNHATITGGTGRYAGATGFIHDVGTLNFASGVVSVDYNGRITTP